MKKFTTLLTLTLIVITLASTSAKAQEGFVGEIRMFGGNFAPRGWALCQGQLLSINSNFELFSILGTTYGGDGRVTFGLPDLRSRVAMGTGEGPALSNRRLGQKIGSENMTLNISHLPVHNHQVSVTGGTNANVLLSTDTAVRNTPQEGDVPAAATFGPGLSATEVKAYGPATNTVNGQTITTTTPNVTTLNTGGQRAFGIIQPSTVVNYIICLQGTFPSRN
ncbi:phage tail protein [Wenyingzhuangia sp. IMCC45533]